MPLQSPCNDFCVVARAALFGRVRYCGPWESRAAVLPSATEEACSGQVASQPEQKEVAAPTCISHTDGGGRQYQEQHFDVQGQGRPTGGLSKAEGNVLAQAQTDCVLSF